MSRRAAGEVRGPAGSGSVTRGAGAQGPVRRPVRGAGGRTLGLRAQVALVIAVLALLPNIVTAMLVLLPVLVDSAGVDRLWLPVGLWLLATVAFAAGIGYLLSRYLLAPLAKLRKEVAALPETTDRLATARLAFVPAEPHEVRDLRRAFNRLLERIEVEHDRRSAFMATLMHDMKTPLVATNHLLEVIRDRDDLGPDQRVELVERMREENEAILELVQQLVDAHRFERQDVVLRRERVELVDLVRGVIERVRLLAAERGVTIHCEGSATAWIDARELERAVYNLVTNAVRHARSRIAVEIFSGLIRISDDGPGLPGPLESLAQPFNGRPTVVRGHLGQQSTGSGITVPVTPYSNASSTTARTLGGGKVAAHPPLLSSTGGLGLFIVRRILEAHGGQLIVERTSPKGSTLLMYFASETENP